MDNIIDKFGGRKFVVSIVGLIVFTLLAIFKPEAITAEFLTGILGIIGSFSVSNVVNTKTFASSTPTQDTNLQDEIKTNKLEVDNIINEQNKLLTNYGDNLRAHENAINRLLDLIQSKLPLTQVIPNANMNIQQQQQVVESSGQNAQQNREAINQYLSKNF